MNKKEILQKKVEILREMMTDKNNALKSPVDEQKNNEIIIESDFRKNGENIEEENNRKENKK